jgi:hypothetical protein
MQQHLLLNKKVISVFVATYFLAGRLQGKNCTPPQSGISRQQHDNTTQIVHTCIHYFYILPLRRSTTNQVSFPQGDKSVGQQEQRIGHHESSHRCCLSCVRELWADLGGMLGRWDVYTIISIIVRPAGAGCLPLISPGSA